MKISTPLFCFSPTVQWDVENLITLVLWSHNIVTICILKLGFDKTRLVFLFDKKDVEPNISESHDLSLFRKRPSFLSILFSRITRASKLGSCFFLIRPNLLVFFLTTDASFFGQKGKRIRKSNGYHLYFQLFIPLSPLVH